MCKIVFLFFIISNNLAVKRINAFLWTFDIIADIKKTPCCHEEFNMKVSRKTYNYYMYVYILESHITRALWILNLTILKYDPVINSN